MSANRKVNRAKPQDTYYIVKATGYTSDGIDRIWIYRGHTNASPSTSLTEALCIKVYENHPNIDAGATLVAVHVIYCRSEMDCKTEYRSLQRQINNPAWVNADVASTVGNMVASVARASEGQPSKGQN